MVPTRVTFRRLVDDDLPMLHRWLNEPGVVRWWEGDDVSWEAVQRDYGSASTDPTEHWVASVDGREVGWIQCYATADFEHEDEVVQWRALGVGADTGGIDYLIGRPEDRGAGIGTAMLRDFLPVAFALHPQWRQIGASPQVANVASWRALEKAGFTALGDFPDEHGPCRLMVVTRQRERGSPHPV